MAEDYYSVLGVSRTATAEEIQKAYRKLARKHHPDLAEDKEKAKVRFQQIQHAYDVLGDPKKRQLYDQLGPAFEQAGGQNPFQGGQMPEGVDLEQIFGRGGMPVGGLDEILQQIFGGQQGSAGPGAFGGFGGKRRKSSPHAADAPVRGQDLEQDVVIPFATSIVGGKHQLSLLRPDGSPDTVTVTIPAGITTGKKIRLRGLGQPVPRGPRGDLLINIKVAPHPNYQRIGDNLQVIVPITFSEAALGAKVELPTPHGKVSLTIPPNSSSGRVLRLRGFGVNRPDGSSGDLLAEVRIVFPKPLGKEQESLARQWAAISADENPRSELVW